MLLLDVEVVQEACNRIIVKINCKLQLHKFEKFTENFNNINFENQLHYKLQLQLSII
uniref:Uncharacterized protein n=1 Tax=Arion vulgaris TaxID=1028688 RepID=A0A0B7AEB1_9EUPU